MKSYEPVGTRYVVRRISIFRYRIGCAHCDDPYLSPPVEDKHWRWRTNTEDILTLCLQCKWFAVKRLATQTWSKGFARIRDRFFFKFAFWDQPLSGTCKLLLQRCAVLRFLFASGSAPAANDKDEWHRAERTYQQRWTSFVHLIPQKSYTNTRSNQHMNIAESNRHLTN